MSDPGTSSVSVFVPELSFQFVEVELLCVVAVDLSGASGVLYRIQLTGSAACSVQMNLLTTTWSTFATAAVSGMSTSPFLSIFNLCQPFHGNRSPIRKRSVAQASAVCLSPSIRYVRAQQNEKTLFTMMAAFDGSTFTTDDRVMDHQLPMPADAPDNPGKPPTLTREPIDYVLSCFCLTFVSAFSGLKKIL